VSDGRIPPVEADSTDPALAAVFDVFRDAGRDVPMLYRTLGRSPAMLQAWTSLAWPLRQEATSPRGLRELLIMRVAQLTTAPFEWLAHWDMAVKHGITVEQLDALADWPHSGLFSDRERAALALTDELTEGLDVADDTWSELAEHFAEGELVELVLTVSFYSCVSRVLHALRLSEVDESDPRLAALSAAGSTDAAAGSSSAPSG
jgi:4-carboxymuconolactone decarboxylase